MNSFAFNLSTADLPEPKVDYKKSDSTINDLQSAMEIAGISIFNLDLVNRKIRFCAQHPSVCQLPVHQNIPISAVLNLVDAEHQQSLIDIFNAAARYKKDAVHEFEVKSTGAGPKWLKVTANYKLNCDKKTGYFLCLLTDITHKKQHETRRNDLVTMLNHDLRTPLTTIKLYLQMFSKLAVKSDHFNTSKLLNIASNQVDSMTKMMENFLETTVLESGKVKINRTGFEITSLINQLISNEYLPRTKHQFQINCPDKIWIKADKDKITQVLHNYISNAVKYSPESAPICIYGRKIKDQIIINVKDNGIGISASDQKELFSKFFRSAAASVQQIKGYGIGLYLVKDIIEEHHGKVWATSNAGQGSNFYFSLPAADN